MQLGPYIFETPLALAPMAGVTDAPFRNLCRRLGADLATSEMLTSDRRLWSSAKSRTRLPSDDEPEPRSVQIAGADPHMMAEAARANAALGAEIIDINMGCPAKKVCNQAAGSALMQDVARVEAILRAVVEAVDLPVTLKMRTGWDRDHRNGVEIAQIAETIGIQALAVHGRTRADAYRGEAEYDTIRAIKAAVSIPVLANGDIDSPLKAREVLDHTGADGLMIGRAAQGNPWLFREIRHYLTSGDILPSPTRDEICTTLIAHVQGLHALYGIPRGVRVARKHIGWYLESMPQGSALRARINRIEDAETQLHAIETALLQPSKEILAA
ncbi:MAG: tRNA dihydrouridine synthase DusB [Gammaproteobacteria bacterium]